MQTLRKQSLFYFMCLLAGFSALTATQDEPSLSHRAFNTTGNLPSNATDTALVLSVVWFGIAAVASYRLAELPETKLPTAIKLISDYVYPMINLQAQEQLKFNALGCVGGSLSALGILLLKKLSWERGQQHNNDNN